MSLKLEEQTDTLPDGWRREPIREICEVGGGKTPRKSTEAYWGGEIPWVSSKDFDGPRMLGTEDHLTDHALQDTSVSRYSAGDIVMVVRSGVLKHSLPVAILETDAAVNQDIKVLQPDENRVDEEYLLNALLYESDRIRTSCMKTGTTVQSIEMSFLKSYKLPIPPLEEQRRIAEVLSTVDEKIRETEEIIETTEELKQGITQDLFSEGTGSKEIQEVRVGPRFVEISADWELRSVADLAADSTEEKAIRGGPPGGKIKKEERSPDGAKLYVQENVIYDDFEMRGDYLSEEMYEDLKSAKVNPGDVLVTRSGTIGRSQVFPKSAPRGILGSSLIRIKVDESTILPEYLSQYINDSHMAWAQIESMSHGGTRTGLNNKIVKSIQVPIPSLEEQYRIIEHLSKIDTKLRQERGYKQKLQQLKRGLMQDLLTGKVRTPESISADD